MSTLQDLNEYDERLNKRLTTFGEIQKQIERQRENFFENVDRSFQEKKDEDALAEGRQEQEELEEGEVKYED